MHTRAARLQLILFSKDIGAFEILIGDFLHYITQINCLTGGIIVRHILRIIYILITKYDPPQDPPRLHPHEGAGWTEGAAGILEGRPRGGLSGRYFTQAGVRLQAIHRHDLLPLAHVDGEGLGPLGDHQVWAGIWGRQRLLLATNMHVHVLRPG